MSPESTQVTRSVGIIGARGYTGAELMRLVFRHPRLSLAFASSRGKAGEPVRDVVSEAPADLRFGHWEADDFAHTPAADVVVLALPDGAGESFVEAIEATRPGTVVVDLGADHRFDDNWVYGLAEHNRSRIAGATRIANPGCYATAMHLALRPLVDRLSATPCCFGVSGYSGAGTTPGERNDPDVLRDNLLAYKAVDHTHEREVSYRLGHAVRFVPHVASFFRGIHMTVMAEVREATSVAALLEMYRGAYADDALVAVREEVPRVRDIVGQCGAVVGGFAVQRDQPTRLTVMCVLDNLLKGAASQAIQNINLALGMPMNEGLV
ncbi:MAG: N-acetyl-gamma-glutamyl-phosphate reductase [Phycisphaerales bacterium]|nr:N-acetyl-gamma-glutamyl-phosphate reductase [Phycisphaerales bacterium]